MSDQTSTSYRTEVEAIGDVLASLEPLAGPARERVLAYVANALNIAASTVGVSAAAPISVPTLSPAVVADPAVVPTPTPAVAARHTDIRSLRDSKQPRSAVEMAAIVAYYLNDVAPEGEKRQTIGKSDLDKYFKQAGFPLPKAQNMTLVNATSGGYFDRVDQGQYKLNPVGYNLVVHNLPARSGEAGTGSRTARRARSTKRAATKRPTAKRAAPAKKGAVKKTATRRAGGAKKTTVKKATSRPAKVAAPTPMSDR